MFRPAPEMRGMWMGRTESLPRSVRRERNGEYASPLWLKESETRTCGGDYFDTTLGGITWQRPIRFRSLCFVSLRVCSAPLIVLKVEDAEARLRARRRADKLVLGEPI